MTETHLSSTSVRADALSSITVDGVNCNDLATLTLEQERKCVQKHVNQLRASVGALALTLNSQLNQGAQAWTQQMAEAGAISHSQDLVQQFDSRFGIGNWFIGGENVGSAGPASSPTVFDDLMAAFDASPGHYANMVLKRYTHIGVGSVRQGGVWWVTQWFIDLTP